MEIFFANETTNVYRLHIKKRSKHLEYHVSPETVYTWRKKDLVFPICSRKFMEIE